jgi:hypothetical protein
MYLKNKQVGFSFGAIGEDLNYEANSQRSADIFANNLRKFSLAQQAPAIQIAAIQSEPARITAQYTAPAQADLYRGQASQAVASGQSSILKARTANLKATADVSKDLQQPVKAKVIEILPWALGGLAAIGLVMLVLHRRKK